ncbi:hypothetical protein BH18ACT1_BH18ACT1_16350 [soil metagenome]
MPDSDERIPLRILMSRAYQLAAEPESALIITSSGRRGDSSQNTRWGLTGSASFMARASTMRHQRSTSASMPARQERSSLRRSIGRRARRVARLSPTRLTSIG